MPVLPEERDLMALSAENNWQFRVIGVAPVPKSPIFCNGWWIVPVADDHSQIPERSLARVRAIYQAGIRPKAFIIAHEAKQLLPSPMNAPKVSRGEVWAKQMLRISSVAVNVTGKILVDAVLPVLAATLSALFASAIASATLVDPCLIAVTDENVWIQIDYWMV